MFFTETGHRRGLMRVIQAVEHWFQCHFASIRGGLVAGLLCLSVMGDSLAAGGEASQLAPMYFSISAQSLNSALAAYSAVTGSQMLYNSELVVGHRSEGVTGVYAPDEALRILLVGSNLVARRIDIDAITIERVLPAQRASVQNNVPDARFLGAVQTAILGALCRNSETKPGTYRAVLQLWISSANVIQHARLVGSTGDSRRDAVLAGTLENVKIDMPLPANVLQPITMMIVPRDATLGQECPYP